MPLTVPGAAGRYRRRRVAPDSAEALWGTLERHELRARVGATPDGRPPEAAWAGLLESWDAAIAAGEPSAEDAEATVTWPSRDTAMTGPLLAHGLAPRTVVAVRPAGRPMSAGPARVGDGVAVRPLTEADLARAVALWCAQLRWDTQFGGAVERPTAAGLFRQQLAGQLAAGPPWAWVAEAAGGEVVGLVVVEPPEEAGWIAPLVAAGPAAYVSCLMVTAAARGAGVGAALVRVAHEALERAGAAVTVLHHAALSPLSPPFWHRCGYRPLWTTWSRRPPLRPGAGS